MKSVISDGFSSAPVYKDDGENQEITVSKLEDKIDVFEIALYKTELSRTTQILKKLSCRNSCGRCFLHGVQTL